MNGVVLKTEHLADFIEEFRWLTSCCITPISSPLWRPESIDHRHRAKLPINQWLVLTRVIASPDDTKTIVG